MSIKFFIGESNFGLKCPQSGPIWENRGGLVETHCSLESGLKVSVLFGKGD